MVAMTTTPVTTNGRAVVLPAGEEASGLAHMMGQYLDQVMADSDEKRSEAKALRGRLGMLARGGRRRHHRLRR